MLEIAVHAFVGARQVEPVDLLQPHAKIIEQAVYGRRGSMAQQRVRVAAVAQCEVRPGVSEGLKRFERGSVLTLPITWIAPTVSGHGPARKTTLIARYLAGAPVLQVAARNEAWCTRVARRRG